jgi:Chaperone of endosialidase
MATFTTNFNFALPVVGSDKNAWGNFLNQNWNSLDTLLKTATDTSNAALPKAGGTMTGFITLNADPTASMHPVTKQYADAADTALSARVTTAQTTADTAISNAATAQTTANARVPTAGDATKTGNLTVTGTFTANGDITAASGRINVPAAANGGVRGSATEVGFYSSDGLKSCRMTLSSGDFTTTGQVFSGGNVTAASDARLKMDVEQIREALSLVNRMRGVFYTRIDTGESQVGVIAQEMQEIIPQVVHESASGMLGVSYGNLVGVLIEAVKELSDRVEKLESR